MGGSQGESSDLDRERNSCSSRPKGPSLVVLKRSDNKDTQSVGITLSSLLFVSLTISLCLPRDSQLTGMRSLLAQSWQAKSHANCRLSTRVAAGC